MHSKDFCVSLVGFGLVLGLATAAHAGAPPVTCPYAIEVNAVRGGSPSIKGGSKNITAKARIAKGTAASGTSQPGTTATVDAICVSGACTPGANLGSASAGGITLVVGKGGQGPKLAVPVACSPGDVVDFVATFTGTAVSNAATCTGVGVSKSKTCQ